MAAKAIRRAQRLHSFAAMRLHALAVCLAIAGCQFEGSPDDPDAPGGRDTSDPTEVENTVEISHRREVRGAWIATVSRINWPTSTNAAAQRAQLIELLDTAKRAGINTIFFQVRPEADALYRSNLEPWSRYLTGTQGVDPGYDPLEFAIEESHRRGMELHAWLNPYRARAGNVGASAANHVINRMPQAVVSYGNLRWLDPGHPDAFDHTLAVIEDLLARYDIDGLHFDDYFYPYPQSGVTFDDDATYAKYGGGMSRADWRRDNVNRMVRAVSELVRTRRPDVRWGISPFGIYRPGMPEGVVGLDQYAVLYADPVRWMEQGWVEYVAPQLYWATTSSGQPYRSLLAWWDAQAAASGRMLLVGNAGDNGFSLAEYRAEMDAIRDDAREATRGAIWWSMRSIESTSNGLARMLANEYYDRPAATPPLVDAEGPPPAPPTVEVEEGVVHITTPPTGIRSWAIYRQSGDEWIIDQLVPAETTSLSLPDGTWAISAIDRSGLESRGVLVEGKGEVTEPTGASCTHSYGGTYADTACSASYQCCDGTWMSRGACGTCACVEETGQVGCSP